MIRITKTENGMVRGIEAADPRITAFKGVPFAAPPIGANRWKAPQPAENWEGVRDCARFAPISMQPVPGLGTGLYDREWHVDPEIPMSEDCLYLNIWTPAKTTEDRLPVFVWFFGGGLQCGYTAEMEFDGERIARRGIVVVSVNYRVGAFGYIAHPEITAENPDAPSNFGSLDQQAGLRWVQRNIAAFGGDASNVTIGGQSAGGGSVLSQLAHKANEGLFRKTIVMSAFIRNAYSDQAVSNGTPLAEAERNGEILFSMLGANSLAEARAIDAKTLQETYEEYTKTNRIFTTVVDGKFHTGDPIEQYRKGDCVDVTMMAGNTGIEFPNVVKGDTEEELRAAVEAYYGEQADKLLSFAEMHAHTDGKGYGVINGIELTIRGIYEEIAAQGRKGYYYCFTPDIPGWDDAGTFHSCDLWFWFETLAKCWRPYVGRHYDLARQMCNYLCNFVKTGDPNGQDADGSALPVWTPYSKEVPCAMNFTGEGAVPVLEEPSDYKRFLMEHILERLDVTSEQ